jgi:DNA-binding GntR family transcriptional regulator
MEIFRGELLPGARLAEAAEAKRLGVSRVPVREAFAVLEREGLLRFTETGRTVVQELTVRDFEELYAMRLILEPAAARAAHSLSRRTFNELRKIIIATNKARSLADVTRLDLDFHELLVAASGNSRLLAAWRALRSELELWLGDLQRRHRAQDLNTRKITADSHTEVLDAFENQSAAACERLVRQHIQGWREWLPIDDAEEDST